MVQGGHLSFGLGQDMRVSRRRNKVSPVKLKPLESLPSRIPSSAFSPPQDWYIRLVKSQCWTRSDSALLEGAELVNRIPPGDLNAFMMNSVQWSRRTLGNPFSCYSHVFDVFHCHVTE